MKQFKLLALLIVAGLCFNACSDDEPDFIPPVITTPGEAGIYVINQGNQTDKIEGSLDYLDLTTNAYTKGVFFAANGFSLGDTPENGVAYGSKLYVAVYGSNLVWVIDRATMAKVAQITTEEPECICAGGGKVFVTNNTGTVSQIDTTALAVTGSVQVGPNPAGCVTVDGDLYVAVSDGYNSYNGAVNGLRVAKIDIATFTKTKDIAVGVNPCGLAADEAGNVFVACMGDYSTVGGKIWKISPDDTATEFCDGTLMAANSGNLYVINGDMDFTTWFTTYYYKAYDIATGQETIADLFGENKPVAPISIATSPADRTLWVTSDSGVWDYSSPGKLYHYSAQGELLATYGTGSHPYALIFD